MEVPLQLRDLEERKTWVSVMESAGWDRHRQRRRCFCWLAPSLELARLLEDGMELVLKVLKLENDVLLRCRTLRGRGASPASRIARLGAPASCAPAPAPRGPLPPRLAHPRHVGFQVNGCTVLPSQQRLGSAALVHATLPAIPGERLASCSGSAGLAGGRRWRRANPLRWVGQVSTRTWRGVQQRAGSD